MAAGQLVTRQPGARLAAVGRAALREGAGQLRDGGEGSVDAGGYGAVGTGDPSLDRMLPYEKPALGRP